MKGHLPDLKKRTIPRGLGAVTDSFRVLGGVAVSRWGLGVATLRHPQVVGLGG